MFEWTGRQVHWLLMANVNPRATRLRVWTSLEDVGTAERVRW